MTPRDRADRRPAPQAHRLPPTALNDEHHARPADAGDAGERDRSSSYRAGVGRPPSGGPRRGRLGLPGVVRFFLFIGLLAALVLTVSLTVLRPVVARAVVDWAAQNPSALRLPFVADLVREDLGAALTTPASSDPAQLEFTVAQGDTASSIARRLQDQGLLVNARAFVFITIQRDLTGSLEAGTYILRKNMPPDQLVTALLVAKDRAITITLREGLRIEQIAAKLQTIGLTMDVQAFYDEAKHPPAMLLSDYPWLRLPKGASLEGFLAPATYQVLPDVKPDAFIRLLLDRFYATVGPDRLAVPKSRGLSFYQVLSLASIVEHEAVLDQERAIIAGVYQNRLNQRPFILNADPTVLFANDTMALVKLPFNQWPTYVFWAYPATPLGQLNVAPALAGYQTYQNSGLIPGPISTPSLASIDAALAPNTKTGYFYFVAIPNGGGQHAFARTLAQQEANLRKYGYR